MDGGGGGGGGTFFVLYETGLNNPDYPASTIVNIPLIIASGGHGASPHAHGIDGLCDTSETRNNYGVYYSDGKAGRGGSFRNDFDTFKSYSAVNIDFNVCNPTSFLDSEGCVRGGKACPYIINSGCGGAGGGGGDGEYCGGAGGGYIDGLVVPVIKENNDFDKYKLYGALSYSICENNDFKVMKSGANAEGGKIEISFVEQ